MPKNISHANTIKYPLLAKTNLVIKDIQVLCECGLLKAMEYRHKYLDWCIANGIKRYDPTVVNTDLFIKFTNEEDSVPTIDVVRIEKYAKKGF